VLGTIVALGLGALVVRSQSKNSVIETVRGGVFNDYNTTTVGKAFEGTFQDAKWSSFETPKGETVVQFDGTNKGVPPVGRASEGQPFNSKTAVSIASKCVADHPKYTAADVDNCISNTVIPVQFQFTLSADQKQFRLSYVDDAFFNNQKYALPFIYK